MTSKVRRTFYSSLFCSLILIFVITLLTSHKDHVSVSEVSLASNQEIEWWESQGISIQLEDLTSNIILEDLLQERELSHSIPVNSIRQNSSFSWTRQSGIKLSFNLSNIELFSKYHDVIHTDNDNDFIMNAKYPSIEYDLQKPLQFVIDNFCREPVPDHYFLVMQQYYNRYTKGKKIICNKSQMQTGSRRCPDNFYNGQIYTYRTVNERCSLNKATYLNQETNNFFCTQNNPLLNEIFLENISEKIVSVSQGECQRNRRFCEECIRQSCSLHLKAIEIGSSHNCCHNNAQCLLQPSCIDYYSPSCYYRDIEEQQHNLCMKGSTYKFTLNPQFSLNNSFMCHLKPIQNPKVYSIQLTIIIPHWLKVSFSLIENITTTKSHCENENLINCTYHSPVMNLNHEYMKSSFSKRTILKSENKTYSIYKLRSKFNRNNPTVEKHINLKYSKIQISEPFLINSKNWMKKSCFINISGMMPYQSLYEESSNSVVDVVKIERMGSKFEYVFKSPGDIEEVNLFIKEKSSVLKSAICGLYYSDQSSRSSLYDVKVIFYQKYQRNWTWNLEIKGSFDNSFEFYNIQLKEKLKTTILFNKDILIIKLPVTEKNVFSLNHSIRFFPESSAALKNLKLTLIISDCRISKTFNMILQPIFNKTLFNNVSNNEYFNRNDLRDLLSMTHILAILQKLSLLFIIFLSILSFFILFYFIFKLILWQKNPKTITTIKQIATKFRSFRKRKCLIMVYVTLRIFYTFVFTSTCIISLILTVNLKGIIQKKEEIKTENYYKDQIMKIYESNLINLGKKCNAITQSDIRKIIFNLNESLNNTITTWYHSKESVLTINRELFERRTQNVTDRIIAYFNTKIIENIGLRLADQKGLVMKLYEDTSRLKWLNIISSWSDFNSKYLQNIHVKKKTKVNIDLYPVLTITRTDKFIKLNLNLTFENLKNRIDFNEFFKDSSFLVNDEYKSKSKHYRIFISSILQENLSIKLRILVRRDHNPITIIDDGSLSFIRIRICLFILDLLLIFSRCYNIYKDFQSIWFGSEKVLLSKYANVIASSGNEFQIDELATDRETAISAYKSSTANICIMSSLGKVKIFKCHYYLVLVILTGLSILLMYIFIICQSTGPNPWIKTMLNLRLKKVPLDFIGQIERRIYSLLTNHQSKKKRQSIESIYTISTINRQMFIATFNNFQNFQRNVHTSELCYLLRVLSHSKNNNIMKLKMQSQYLFIPLQLVDECLQNKKKNRNMIHIEQQTCPVSNTTFSVNFRPVIHNPNQKQSEILFLFRFRDLILLASIIILITFVFMNILKFIIYSRLALLSDQISTLHIFDSRPPSISENLNQDDTSTILWPLLRSTTSEIQDPYFTVSCIALPKTYPICKRLINRETDI